MIIHNSILQGRDEKIRECLKNEDYQHINMDYSQIQSQYWRPSSWYGKENTQPLPFSAQDEQYLQHVSSSQYLQLVDIDDIIAFKKSIHRAAFIIQGGYCAESFSDANHDTVYSVVDLLQSMKNKILRELDDKDSPLILLMPRMAGQYAKPRSSPVEASRELGQVIPSYRGDMIHEYAHNRRVPDPKRILLARNAALKTLEILYIRYRELMTHGNSLPVMGTCHEAFCLWYEQLNTKMLSITRGVNTGAYFLWLGERTGSCLNGAHIEYLRGIENPLGIKVGPSMTGKHLCSLIEILNPDHEYGKICLITRFGSEKVRKCLPDLIISIRESGYENIVRWICDPMHGNTKLISQIDGISYKTRYLPDILKECLDTFDIHRQYGSICSGLHLECTGEIDCFECLTKDELEVIDSSKYTTKCDPRLNSEQLNKIFDNLLPDIINSIQSWHNIQIK